MIVPKVFELTSKIIVKSKISIYTWSKRMPKYWSNGDVCPGWVGTLKQMQINQMIQNLMIELLTVKKISVLNRK